jgi:hypothetical protein
LDFEDISSKYSHKGKEVVVESEEEEDEYGENDSNSE